MPESLRENTNVRTLSVDLLSSEWSRSVRRELRGQPIRGVVHAAWPGMPNTGLLELSVDQLNRQLRFATDIVVDLAKLVKEQTPVGGAAIVAIGSITGTHTPNISVGGYSLAKSTLESTVRLLAPELAPKNISINVVAPDTLPTGINRTLSTKQQMLHVARVPAGRLCQTEDVVSAVHFLLTQPARFISGQTLALTGGRI